MRAAEQGHDRIRGPGLHGDPRDQARGPDGPGQDPGALLPRRGLLRPRRPRHLLRQGRATSTGTSSRTSSDWRQLKGEASGTGLGGEAAFGGEWEIAPRTDFFAEAGVRLARFGKLTGDEHHHAPDRRRSPSEPGTLFYVTRLAEDGNAYPLVYVAASAPDDAVDSRRAVVDLSGTALRAGCPLPVLSPGLTS
ncbi:MAG: hypothetical protein M0C28_24160 [Candidatus Moduliflexus flocculans]|nr:hypothetical protein [Candidatus Moduliflexus flocculans]